MQRFALQASIKAHTRAVDAQLKALWRLHCQHTSACLLAVGGYGRGELFLHSDIDVLLLLPRADDAVCNTAVQAFITALWDTGRVIGHSVRTQAECLTESAADITVQTSLVEMRFLAGDKVAFTQLSAAFTAQLQPVKFLQAKVLEQRQRHQRFENTPYSLEPNCKESPGGLRDLHILLWVARAAKLGRDWDEMAAHGLLTAAELTTLRKSERLIKTIRQGLHRLAKRREDRLVFDLQSSLATQLGYQPQGNRRASEVMMQKYYLAAKAVSQLNALVLHSIELRLSPAPDTAARMQLAPGYSEQNGLLHADDLQQFAQEPLNILRAVQVFNQHPHLRDFSPPTQRAIWNARDGINHSVRQAAAFKALFLQLFTRGAGLTRSLRWLNALGLLSRCLPVFRATVGQMQHDLFHIYTVDQHTLTVVRNVRRFAMAEHTHEYPFCSALMAQFDQPHLLYLAALFHDIGKGRGGDHSDIGAVEVARFGKQFGLAVADVQLLVFLVKNHLQMSSFAQKNDLSDPDVIAKFAQLVGTATRLQALYLLTVADIRGTSPKVWNTWKARLLLELFERTQAHLGGNVLGKDSLLAKQQNEALKLLGVQANPALWQQLDVAYCLRSDPADLAWHAAEITDISQQTIALRRDVQHVNQCDLLVYTPDQTDLFARLCSAFDALGFSVLGAQIHTTFGQFALDHFVLQLGDSRVLDDAALAQLNALLVRRLNLDTALPAPLSGRLARQSRHFPISPQISLEPDEGGGQYLLNLSCTDQAGLLSRIARVFSTLKISVQMARINTLGARAEDFFLIKHAELSSAKFQAQLETALLQAMEIQ